MTPNYSTRWPLFLMWPMIVQSDPDLGTPSGERVLSTKSGCPLNRGEPYLTQKTYFIAQNAILLRLKTPLTVICNIHVLMTWSFLIRKRKIQNNSFSKKSGKFSKLYQPVRFVFRIGATYWISCLISGFKTNRYVIPYRIGAP